MPPNLSAAAVTHLWMASAERTSTGIATTFDPVSRSIRAAAAAIDAPSLDEIDTVAPSCAKACATAYPSPLLAPAIRTTLFLRFRSIISFQFPATSFQLSSQFPVPSRQFPDRSQTSPTLHAKSVSP